MRIRVDLTQTTYDQLVAKALEERRPADWQAEVLIESGLGIRNQRTTAQGACVRKIEADGSASADQRESSDALR